MFGKLNILKQYLIVSLKQNCGVEELKDAKVLYNASLVQHFREALLKPLNQLNSIDDYQKLDYCLVYNLLRNVCTEHVKPPRKGWDYEPVVDDFSLGADIERIRLFWNRYCDEKEDDMHSCDMILKRMKDKFGDISGNDEGVNSDEWKMRKEKITSIFSSMSQNESIKVASIFANHFQLKKFKTFHFTFTIANKKTRNFANFQTFPFC